MEKRVLIARWLGEAQPIPIYDEASVASARQRVREVGLAANLNKEVVEHAALLASELSHNHLHHARQGYIAVRAMERQDVKGLEVIAADMGTGIATPAAAIVGRTSPAGSLGAGLSAVCRIADEVEIDNRLQEGLCVVARKFESAAPAVCCEVAIMGRPYPGEAISGDDGVFFTSESRFLGAVADGLGHGPEARQASNRALESVSRNRERNLEEMISLCNDDVAGTRGCALCIVRFSKDRKAVECVSLGDVNCHLYTLREAHLFAATPFVLGGGKLRQRIRIEQAPVAVGTVLIMFSDGLKSRTSLKGQLDVLRKPAIAIAQHLIEGSSRPDDDALVLVAKFR